MTRKEMIVKAIELISSKKETFICCALDEASGAQPPSSGVIDTFEIFPELRQFMPESKMEGRAWWTNDEDGRAKRIQVLNSLKDLIND